MAVTPETQLTADRKRQQCERRRHECSSSDRSGPAPGLLEHRPGQSAGPSAELLFERLRNGDASAGESIAAMYLPLARRLAQRYVRSSEPREDLVQVASVGLVKAIERFDPGRGPTFASFAIPTILGELRRYFRDATWAVHVPRGAQERAMAIEAAQEQLRSTERRAPTVAEISEYLDLPEEEVLDGLLAVKAYEAESLDAPNGGSDEEGRSPLELIGEEDVSYELIEADASVVPAIRALGERDRRVLHLRFVGEMSQSEIAAQIGVSQMQVSRIIARSLAELRKMANGAGDRDRARSSPPRSRPVSLQQARGR
jgi:RNA polymerase sigma-B factor